MSHLLRKIAIIGLIAVNSPVHSGKPVDASVRQAAEAVRSETRGMAGSLAAAREAAEILAGMDPALRERVLGAAVAAVAGRQAAPR